MCPVPAGRVCDKPTTQTADYHCLDPWTAETSGKWLDGRKSPYQATAKTNMENGNMSGSWEGIFETAEGGTRLHCSETVNAKHWWMRPFVPGYLKRQQRLYVGDLRRELQK